MITITLFFQNEKDTVAAVENVSSVILVSQDYTIKDASVEKVHAKKDAGGDKSNETTTSNEKSDVLPYEEATNLEIQGDCQSEQAKDKSFIPDKPIVLQKPVNDSGNKRKGPKTPPSSECIVKVTPIRKSSSKKTTDASSKFPSNSTRSSRKRKAPALTERRRAFLEYFALPDEDGIDISNEKSDTEAEEDDGDDPKDKDFQPPVELTFIADDDIVVVQPSKSIQHPHTLL